MRQKRIFISLFTCLLILLILFGFWFGKKKERGGVKIAAILPLTGFMSSFGEQMKQGQELAEELINSNFFWHQRHKIKIIFEDGKGEPKESLVVYKKSRMKNIHFFTTTLSPVSLTLIPLVRKENVLLFADAAHPSISNSGKFIFRHSSTADQEAEVIAKFIKNQDLNRIAILVVNDDYGRAFQMHLKKLLKYLNKTIVQSITHVKGERRFRSIVLKLLKNKPEAVIICSVGAAPGLIVSKLREYRYKGEIIATNTFGYPEAKRAAGKSAEGVHYIVFDFNRQDPIYKQINKKFKQKYGTEMSDLSLLEFNTIMILADAINNVGDDVEKVAEYIRNLKEYRAVGEIMQILPTGDIRPKLKIITYQCREL